MISKFLQSEKIKNLCIVFLTFLILLSTQILMPISFMGKTLYLYAVELCIALIFAVVAVRLIFKKEKLNFSVKQLILPAAFAAWFVVLTVYRFFFESSISGAFIIVRVMFFPIIMLFILKQLKISKKYICYGITAFMTYINIYQAVSVPIKKSFRYIVGLKNINIYLCFALAMLPLLFSFIFKDEGTDKAERIITKAAAWFNLLVISCISLFSGSRLALLLYVVIMLLCCAINFKKEKGVIKKIIALLLAVLLLAFLIVLIKPYDAVYNFSRSSGIDLSSISFNQGSAGIEPPQDEELMDEANGVTDSNNMRLALWTKAISYIKENPIFGRYTVDIECDFVFAGTNEPVKISQSPHNFILEMWLAFGLFGMLLYLAMLGIAALKIFKIKACFGQKVNFLLGMVAIWGFSFFQPLVTCYFAISLLLWLYIYIFSKSPNGAEE